MIYIDKSLFRSNHNKLSINFEAFENSDDAAVVAHIARTFDYKFVGGSCDLRVFSVLYQVLEAVTP